MIGGSQSALSMTFEQLKYQLTADATAMIEMERNG